jgi:phage terminase large subunit-like protein
LQEKQITVLEFGQGYMSMSAPTKEIERLVVSLKLVHPNNPVLTWCASNVVVQMDPAGNVKPNRERSGEKIDGVVAMAMAIGRILARQKEPAFDIRVF